MSTIANLVARLGFDVDTKGLAEFEKKLDNTANSIKQNSKSTVAANKKAEGSAKKATAAQHKLAKETRARFSKVRESAESANDHLRKIDKELRGNLSDSHRKQLLESKSRTQQFLDNQEQAKRRHEKRLGGIHAEGLRGERSRETRARKEERGRYRQRMSEARRLNRTRAMGSRYGGGRSFRGIRENARAWVPGIGSAFALTQSTRSYQDAIGMEQGLSAAAGSTEQGSKDLEWMIKLSQELGLAIQDLGSNFAQLSAATQGSTLKGQGTRDIFRAVASYSKVLNLGSNDIKGVFRALTQMVSKGSVYAEELSQQFGERLPGGISAAARAMGMVKADGSADEAALRKAAEMGELKAEDLFPKLAEELMRMANRGDQLAAAMNNTASAIGRFRTNVWLANRTFNQFGYDDTVRDVMNGISDAMMRAEPLWIILGELSEHLGRALRAPVELFGALAERLGYFTAEGYEASTQLKLMTATFVALVRPLRKLWAAFYLIPFAIAAITDTLDNGINGWDDFGIKLASWAGAAVALHKALGGVNRILGSGMGARAAGAVGGAAATGATGGYLAALGAAPLAVKVVGFLGAFALGSLIKELWQGIKKDGWSALSTDTGSGWETKKNNRTLDRIKRPEWLEKTFQPLLNSSGGLSQGAMPFGEPLYGEALRERHGLLNDQNLEAYLNSRLSSHPNIAKPQNNNNNITINVDSPDPLLAGTKVQEVLTDFLNGELRIASSSELVTEK